MLRELRIKNLALIEDAALVFEDGFSVFTGETGAGKSILVGAIGLLLGERANAEMVRTGFEEAEVCGTFEFKAVKKSLRDLLASLSVPIEDNSLIVRRTISTNNKNRIFINQVPLPLSTLKKIGDGLIDFHGQHEHQSLLNPETAQIVIDSLSGIGTFKQAYNEVFSAYQEAGAKLEAFDRVSTDRRQKRDVVEFQYNELKSIDMRENEEARLAEELKLLSSTAQRVQCVSQINSVLSDPAFSLGGQIQTIKKNLEALSRFDDSAKQWLADVEGTSSVFTELESFCGSYLEKSGETADPGRIEHINDRLAKIQRLKKKYSCSFDQLFEKMRALKADLDALENTAADRTLLEKETNRLLEKCKQSGEALSVERRKRAKKFDTAVTGKMETLGFSGGLWRTDFAALEKPGPQGLEDCAFSVRTNPGEDVLPLIKIASGGEISRLMLAIKTVLASQDDIPILVFDEIDTGIGGLLAFEVAKALMELGATHQLLCISHLHQIASKADHHYHVFKESSDRRTVTRVEKLSENQRVDEIARMLGGDSIIARKHAQELLRKK
jgi:DNA repair protein RecN (Recombination protein N)